MAVQPHEPMPGSPDDAAEPLPDGAEATPSRPIRAIRSAAPPVTHDGHVALAATLEAARRQVGAALRSAVRPGSYLGLVREMALTSVHAAMYPLGLLPAVSDHAPPPTPHLTPRPVLLIHGWVHNRTGFLLMQRRLRRAGLGPIATYEYASVGADLDVVAHRIDPVVRRLVARGGGRRCVLIGHSMGGLVARQYVQELGGDQLVDTVVTLGTPHRGTLSAFLGIAPPITQCQPGSAYLSHLARTARPGLAHWIAYYSDLDFMITPAISAKLTHPALGATNVRVRDIGHLSMLLSRSVLDDIVRRLDEIDEEAEAQSVQTRTSGA